MVNINDVNLKELMRPKKKKGPMTSKEALADLHRFLDSVEKGEPMPPRHIAIESGHGNYMIIKAEEKDRIKPKIRPADHSTPSP